MNYHRFYNIIHRRSQPNMQRIRLNLVYDLWLNRTLPKKSAKSQYFGEKKMPTGTSLRIRDIKILIQNGKWRPNQVTLLSLKKQFQQQTRVEENYARLQLIRKDLIQTMPKKQPMVESLRGNFQTGLFPIYFSNYTEKGANNLYLNNIRTKVETTPDIQSISAAETTLDMTVTGFLCRQIVNQRNKITSVSPQQKQHTRLEAKLTLIQKQCLISIIKQHKTNERCKKKLPEELLDQNNFQRSLLL